VSERERDHELRIARLEEKVALLMRRIGIEDDAAGASDSSPLLQHAEVERLIRAGRKIEAIKAWRESTGVGLREAKEAVEELERRLQ